MKITWKCLTVLFISFGLLLIPLSGCTPAQRNPQLQRQSYPQGTTGPNITQMGQQSTQQLSNDMKRAENIKKQLSTMKEIKQLNTIVMGDTAVVGYVPSNVSKDANAVKNMITTKVKQTDKAIQNVYVTDSAGLMTRLTQLAGDITNNRPVNDLKYRFNQIIQNIKSAGR